jgi:hypothetical protein
VTATIDHLVYACTDLESTCGWIAEATGVVPTLGGRHPGEGTRNALLSLGERTYLELIAPDESQTAVPKPLAFGIDALRAPSLRAWACSPADIAEAAKISRLSGHRLDEPVGGRRLTPEGSEITWTLALPESPPAGEPGAFSDYDVALLPFLIDWGESPHPATTSPVGLVLEHFVLSGPSPDALRGLLVDIGLEGPWAVEASPEPALRAVLKNPQGGHLTLAS